VAKSRADAGALFRPYWVFGVWLSFETQIPQTDSQVQRQAAALLVIAMAVRGPH
jgi:hypothetical protein